MTEMKYSILQLWRIVENKNLDNMHRLHMSTKFCKIKTFSLKINLFFKDKILNSVKLYHQTC